jgi:hypothetical protein
MKNIQLAILFATSFFVSASYAQSSNEEFLLEGVPFARAIRDQVSYLPPNLQTGQAAQQLQLALASAADPVPPSSTLPTPNPANFPFPTQ